MEYNDILDENGNFTGEVVERSVMHDKKLLHNEIVVFIINDKSQILLEKRSSNKRFHPNKWALCAGLVISGESIEEGAIREIKEELGIEVRVDELKKVNTVKNENSFTTFFCLKNNLDEKDFIIQEDELSEVKWFDIEEVIERINNEDESIIIKKERISILEQLK